MGLMTWPITIIIGAYNRLGILRSRWKSGQTIWRNTKWPVFNWQPNQPKIALQ